ncbi:Ion_trans domain-containing protein [Mucor velutinosus]|uniref:Ion_trans domain-containing protein n=1 Tax=Mucor velutinosus TaxID=708070 RepID=A0AAN7D4S2_9FUNG|nr:Ion_trans domain-containing protein [Mucor velutinosus]
MKKKLPRISRAKFENIAYLTLNVVNMVTYLMVFAASITKAKQGRLAEIIEAIYCTLMCCLLILHEFTSPAWIQNYFGFLTVHRGKGMLMLFLGCIVMCEIAFNIIVAIIAFTIGFAYFILSLIPTLPPPNSFWIHWQNHRDFWAEGLDLTVPKIHTTTLIDNDGHLLHPCAWHPSSSKITSANSTMYYQQRQEDPQLLGAYY